MPRAGSFPSNVNGSGWEASSGLVRGYYQQRPAEQATILNPVSKFQVARVP
jgi:hypothetical protein